jgi:hypothetical protein
LPLSIASIMGIAATTRLAVNLLCIWINAKPVWTQETRGELQHACLVTYDAAGGSHGGIDVELEFELCMLLADERFLSPFQVTYRNG